MTTDDEQWWQQEQRQLQADKESVLAEDDGRDAAIAKRLGMTVAKFRALVAASDAKHGRELREMKDTIKALQPTWSDRIEDLAAEFGVSKYDVIGVLYRASDQLGGNPTEKQIVRKAKEELRARTQQKPPAEPAKTRGRQEKKQPGLVDVMRADQAKKGLYPYGS